MEDEILKDEEPLDDGAEDLSGEKKKDPINDDTDSLDDMEDEELEDKEESYDDVDEM